MRIFEALVGTVFCLRSNIQFIPIITFLEKKVSVSVKMHLSKLVIVSVLFPAAFAHPKLVGTAPGAYKSDVVTPSAVKNATLAATVTGSVAAHTTVHRTLHRNQTVTVTGSPISNTGSPPEAPAKPVMSPIGKILHLDGSEAASCGLSMITVTSKDSVTVTIAASEKAAFFANTTATLAPSKKAAFLAVNTIATLAPSKKAAFPTINTTATLAPSKKAAFPAINTTATVAPSKKAAFFAINTTATLAGTSSSCTEPVTVTHSTDRTVTFTATARSGSVGSSAAQSNSSTIVTSADTSFPVNLIATQADSSVATTTTADSVTQIASDSSVVTTTTSADPVPQSTYDSSVGTTTAEPVSQMNSDSSVVSTTTTEPDTQITSATLEATVAAAPSTTSGSRSKRGILVSGDAQAELVKAFNNSPKISWLVNWYSGPPGDMSPNIEFVPENYGKESDFDGTWTRNAKAAIEAGATHFLGFGETHTDNAKLHMEPGEAVDFWMKEMHPYTNQVKVSAPSIVQPGWPWLTEFLEKCEVAGCDVGFLTIHWFWKCSEIEDFKTNTQKGITLAKGTKPVWIDNFGCSGSVEEQIAFLAEALPYLESTPEVERYAYVALDKETGFLDQSGQGLSQLGQYYANF